MIARATRTVLPRIASRFFLALILVAATDAFAITECSVVRLSRTTPRSMPDLAASRLRGEKSLVTYVAFDGTTYRLHPLLGRNIVYLVPDSWIERTTVAQRRDLVDRTDNSYEVLKELVGEEPDGEGPLVIGVVNQPAGGTAAIGYRWVEIDVATIDMAIESLNDRRGPLLNVVRHEMIHTFDRFGPQLWYFDEEIHAFTNMVEDYMVGMCHLDSDYDMSAVRSRSASRERFRHYLEAEGANWESCVVAGTNCGPLPSVFAWAGVGLHVVDLHGRSAMRGFFTYLRQHEADPEPASPQAKEDRHLEALAAGAGADISCYVSYWKWSLSDAARERMKAFGENPKCLDRDGDGYSALAGDCDDANPLVHPGGIELPNGIDDDCNGIVDDIAVAEPNGSGGTTRRVMLPSNASGSLISTVEHDRVELQVDAPDAMMIEARPLADFWLGVGFEHDGNSTGGSPVSRTTEDLRVVLEPPLSAGSWVFSLFAVKPPTARVPSSASPNGRDSQAQVAYGPYSLSFSKVTTRSEWGRVLIDPARDGRMRARFEMLPGADKRGADQIRFWVTSLGFVATFSATDTSTPEWPVPSGLPAGEYDVRAQLFGDGLPLSNLTAPATFRIERTHPVRR